MHESATVVNAATMTVTDLIVMIKPLNRYACSGYDPDHVTTLRILRPDGQFWLIDSISVDY